MTILRRVFSVMAIGWAAALPFATWAASQPRASFALYGFALIVYGIGSVVCHQRPERSFHLWAAQMPVCARCTGIYVGGALAAAIGVARAPLGGTAHASVRMPEKVVLLVAALPTAATLIVEWVGGDMPANWIRALAGLSIGAAVAWAIAGPRESK